MAAVPGCGFDCASTAEMKQVLDLGVDPSRIIYANPCRSPPALEYALSGEAMGGKAPLFVKQPV